MPPVYRSGSPPPASAPLVHERFGCLFGWLALGIAVAAIIWAWKHPWPGILGVLAAGPIVWVLFKRSARILKANADRDQAAELARLHAIATPFGDAWRKLLVAEGLGDLIEKLAPHIRPAVRLVLSPAAEGDDGLSRANGDPWLPPDFAWPEHDGHPSRFIMQLDLADAHRANPDLPLPADGTLYVFESSEGEWEVRFVPPGERVRVPVPESARTKNHSLLVRFEPYDDLPEIESPADWGLAEDDARLDQYNRLRDYLAGNGGPLHKLGGHPHAVQNPEAIERGGEFRLVLQIDSDDAAGWMWGDLGRLYASVTRGAFEARDLSRIDVEMECG